MPWCHHELSLYQNRSVTGLMPINDEPLAKSCSRKGLASVRDMQSHNIQIKGVFDPWRNKLARSHVALNVTRDNRINKLVNTSCIYVIVFVPERAPSHQYNPWQITYTFTSMVTPVRLLWNDITLCAKQLSYIPTLFSHNNDIMLWVHKDPERCFGT